MDPYVLALQLYLFNKACGGLPLRIAEQVVVTSVVNATCWTARTIGSGVMWLVKPSTSSRADRESTVRESTVQTSNTENIHDSDGTEITNMTKNTTDTKDIYTQFEMITLEQIRELELEAKKE